jgi:hypothetical protein
MGEAMKLRRYTPEQWADRCRETRRRGGKPGPLTEYRESRKTLADELSPSDHEWRLCRVTGLSYQRILSEAALVGGSRKELEKVLGVTQLKDGGWWSTICAWMRMFIPQWNRCFRQTMKDLTTLPDPSAILDVASKALGIAPELLLHLAEHRDEIELFLESQRSLLGTLAESKLWSLVAQGDAATIRWLLPRIKTEAYGDKFANIPGDAPRNVTIVEVMGRED